MDYSYYTTEDFAADESFQASVLGTDASAIALWADWGQRHPEKAAELALATDLVNLLTTQRRRVVPAVVQQQELEKLLLAIKQPVAPRPWRLRIQRVRVAVLVCLVLLTCIGYWLLQRPIKPSELARYATHFGQQRRITLPDGTAVVLNGNSTLEIAAQWQQSSRREVWLTGEAFFEVNHLASAAVRGIASAPPRLQFRVHTGDLDVTVLGTTFNVKSRGKHTQVVLNSGKVQLERPMLFGTDQVVLAPGELAQYSPQARGFKKLAVDPKQYSSWTLGYLTFNRTPLADIIPLLQQTYGLELVVTDETLLRQQVTGSVPSDNAEVLLLALSKVLNVKIVRSGNRVQLLPQES